MLDMYAQCLKHLDKIEEYIHIRLKMLAKIVQNTSFLNHQLQVTSTDPSEDHGHPRNIKVSFKNLVSASRLLKAQISAQMGKYFDSIDLGAYLLHLPDNDGFKLQLRLRSLLPEAFKAESVRVEIISIGEAHDSEVVLTAEGQVFEPGLASIWLWSNVSIYFQYPKVVVNFSNTTSRP